MAKAGNTKMMDTEAGGEQTQYEGQATFVKPQSTSSGQFRETSKRKEASDVLADEKKARGEQTAENVRYGEAISEHGFGGETTGNFGSAESRVGYGGVKDDQEEGKQTRREQGYGGGSGVGA